MINTIKKFYYIFAISFVYFFLEITLFRIVKLIGLQQYWVIIPLFIYIVSKLCKNLKKKWLFMICQLKYLICWHFWCCISLLVLKIYVNWFGTSIVFIFSRMYTPFMCFDNKAKYSRKDKWGGKAGKIIIYSICFI